MLTSQRFTAVEFALIAILCVVAAPSAMSQENDAVTVDVARCIDLESAEARLACFGLEVNAVLEQREAIEADASDAETAGREVDVDASAGAAPPIDPPARSIPARENQDDAGARQAAVIETGADETADEYTGTVVDFYERLPSAYVITLDNGQVWLQTEPKQYPLRPGLEVRIYPTGWGQKYRLHGIGTGNHIQVQRIR